MTTLPPLRASAPPSLRVFPLPTAYCLLPTPRSAAFTLVELLVSIALVVLLLLGVNQVFKLSGDAIGAGTVVSTMTRENRAVQSVIQDDFRGAKLKDPVALVIASIARQDPNTGEIRRESHLKFFRTGVHRRQTADDGYFASNTESPDAFISYALNPYDPQNPSKLRALTRHAMLMQGYSLLVARAGNASNVENCIPGHNTILTGSSNPNANVFFAPLSPNAVALRATSSFANGSTRENFTSARLDLAACDVAEFQSEMIARQRDVADPNKYAGNPNNSITSAWWYPFLYQGTNATQIAAMDVQTTLRKPLDSEQIAKSSPLLVNNVSNFIVEFAGDFITQNPATGATTRNQPDGILDYQVHDTRDSTGARTGVFVTRTRWYGLQRDLDGYDGIQWQDDVVPVRDMLAMYGNASGPVPAVPANQFIARFERDVPGGSNSGPMGDNFTYNNPPFTGYYTCLWTGNSTVNGTNVDCPKLIRILIKVEDPTNRVAAGQWWEYVLTGP